MAQTDLMQEDTQITCVFTTNLPQELQVPKDPVAVPASVTRYGLSQIINHLLSLDPPRPFDFLVNGELVRVPLEKFLLAYDISAETTLQVEYLFAVVPPRLKEQLPHDDWVSAVDGRLCTALLTGAYDGAIRVYSSSGDCLSTSSAHKGPVTAVATLPKPQGPHALTAGKDHVIRMWHVAALAAKQNSETSASLVATYRGHTDAVESIAPDPAGQQFASGSWDGSIKLWRTGRSVAEASAEAAPAVPAKRRKASSGKGILSGGIEEQAHETLQGHTQCVSSVSWPTDDTIISSSWDHSVRRWDAETAAQTETLNSNKAIYCAAAAPGSASVVAFGGADRSLRLWDTRLQSGEELGTRALVSHVDWIVDLAWAPSSPHHIVTASHDKTLKLWDIRTAVPLHTLTGHTDKVLSVTWLGKDRIASGAADCTVKMYTVDLSA